MEDNSGYDTELQKHHETVYFKARAPQSAAAETILELFLFEIKHYLCCLSACEIRGIGVLYITVEWPHK